MLLSQLEELGLPLASLREGLELGEAESEILALAAEAREAERRGLALLARAEQSTFLLKIKLEQRGFSAKAAGLALARLAAAGFLDDARYAGAYAASRLSHGGSKPEGPTSIERELRERGIDKATAAQAVAELFGREIGSPERLYALGLAAKKLLKRVDGDRDEARRRLRELGYRSEEISEYFEELD